MSEPPIIVVDDADTNLIEYTGPWFVESTTGFDALGHSGTPFGGTLHGTSSNASLSFTFNGENHNHINRNFQITGHLRNFGGLLWNAQRIFFSSDTRSPICAVYHSRQQHCYYFRIQSSRKQPAVLRAERTIGRRATYRHRQCYLSSNKRFIYTPSYVLV